MSKMREPEPNPGDAWATLARSVRRHRESPDQGETAPFGFATRVAAIGLEARQKTARSAFAVLERYWLRGMAVAGAVAVLTLLAGLGQIQAVADLAALPELQWLYPEGLL
ncbi:MAG: hypothetical protein AAGK14_08910 [Verrucomicrobiota bacterium]